MATYEDLIKEKWLRDRNSGAITWKTRDGKVIPIKDLDDHHLECIIQMIERHMQLADNLYEAMACGDINYDKD